MKKKRKKINNIHPVLEETASRKEGEIQKACQEERERHPFIAAAVGTTSALNVFQKGDVVVAQDGALAGTVKALTATSITLEANNVGALANTDELLHKSPIRLQIGFEK